MVIQFFEEDWQQEESWITEIVKIRSFLPGGM
jgi:hypothetical protein